MFFLLKINPKFQLRTHKNGFITEKIFINNYKTLTHVNRKDHLTHTILKVPFLLRRFKKEQENNSFPSGIVAFVVIFSPISTIDALYPTCIG